MSNAPTGAAVLRDRDADPSIDGALRAWRSETDRRRAEYQAKASEHNAEQAARRSRFLRAVTAVGATVGVLSAALMWTFGAATPVDVAPTYASVVPSLDVDGFVTPQRSEQVVQMATTAVVGDVRSWTRNGALWLQFDYTGAPMTLQWFDATGAEVLGATPCANRLSSELSRCYIGRTSSRVSIARGNGAVAGTWTVKACQDGACSTVASYPVD